MYKCIKMYIFDACLKAHLYVKISRANLRNEITVTACAFVRKLYIGNGFYLITITDFALRQFLSVRPCVTVHRD